jgi:hypothetical protein
MRRTTKIILVLGGGVALKPTYRAYLKLSILDLQEAVNQTEENEGFWIKSADAPAIEAGLADMKRRLARKRKQLAKLS